MRKVLGALFTALGVLLLTLAIGLTVVGLYGIWQEDGWRGVEWALSPFNIVNFIVMIVSLAPGIGLMILGAKIKGKAE